MNIDSDSTDLIFAEEALVWGDPNKIRLFQEKLLRQNLKRIAIQHPVYSKVIRENNVDISSISTFAELNRLFPITTKEGFLSSPLDYVLTPGRYVGLEEVEDDFDFVEKFTNLKQEFINQLEEEKLLNKRILENLAKINIDQS